MKKLINTLLIILSIMSLSGCSPYPNKSKDEPNITEQALSYMENKYGETFEYAAPWGNSMSGDHSMLVACDSFPDKCVLVGVIDYKTEDKEFRDNYIALKYEDETRRFLESNTSTIFEDYRVYYDTMRQTLSTDISADASFDEYLNDKECRIATYIVTNKSGFNTKEEVENMVNGILDKFGGRYLSVIVVVLSDEKYEVCIDRENVADAIVERKFEYCYRLTYEDDTTTNEWLDSMGE